MRTNSVLSYILMGLEEAGWNVNKIEAINGGKVVDNPTEINNSPIYGINFDKTTVDQMILENELEYTLQDKGINVDTDKGKVVIEFNPARFRPAEVPILLADTHKIQGIGGKIQHSLSDILKDQLNYFLNKENRI
jgi:GDPmannose 4,6-dehydratase